MRSFFHPILASVLLLSPAVMYASPAQAQGSEWRVAAVVLGRSGVAELVRAQDRAVLSVGDRFDGSVVSGISEDGVSLRDGRFLAVEGESRSTAATLSGYSQQRTAVSTPSAAPVVYVTVNGSQSGPTDSGYAYGGYGLYYGDGNARRPRVLGAPPGQANIPPPLGRAPSLPVNSGWKR